MYFPILINRTSPYPILGLLGGICHFHFIFKKKICKQTGEPDQTPRLAASDLVLHCLPMSHKKDARLIWVKILKYIFKRSALIVCRSRRHCNRINFRLIGTQRAKEACSMSMFLAHLSRRLKVSLCDPPSSVRP